ncbi:hypothetical protein FOA52_002471 [Chlamydomonas sp. UWO 241]|nr:hypothetical protein FOA52_002471 [Chlamydomonas sp. UWO 241]
MGKVQFGCASEHVTEVDEKEADSRAVAGVIPGDQRDGGAREGDEHAGGADGGDERVGCKSDRDDAEQQEGVQGRGWVAHAGEGCEARVAASCQLLGLTPPSACLAAAAQGGAAEKLPDQRIRFLLVGGDHSSAAALILSELRSARSTAAAAAADAGALMPQLAAALGGHGSSGTASQAHLPDPLWPFLRSALAEGPLGWPNATRVLSCLAAERLHPKVWEEVFAWVCYLGGQQALELGYLTVGFYLLQQACHHSMAVVQQGGPEVVGGSQMASEIMCALQVAGDLGAAASSRLAKQPGSPPGQLELLAAMPFDKAKKEYAESPPESQLKNVPELAPIGAFGLGSPHSDSDAKARNPSFLKRFCCLPPDGWWRGLPREVSNALYASAPRPLSRPTTAAAAAAVAIARVDLLAGPVVPLSAQVSGGHHPGRPSSAITGRPIRGAPVWLAGGASGGGLTMALCVTEGVMLSRVVGHNPLGSGAPLRLVP